MAGPEGARLALIGRREWVSIPAWGLRRLRAKIDTGAYSSALDVDSYDLVAGQGEGLRARFRLAPSRARPNGAVVEAPVVGIVNVKNSGGAEEQRPLLEPLVCLGPVTRAVRLTLTRRPGLRCRMLLGREALAGAFLVDVSKKDLLRR
jgi:hypothetical protein